MKVLVVNTVSFRFNGITSVIMNYYRSMDKSDVQIDFVTNRVITEQFEKELLESGARVFKATRDKNPLKYMYTLYKILRKGRYDVIHVHGNSAMLFFDMLPAFLAGTRVRIAHSHNTTCTHLKAHKLLKPFFSLLYTHGFACGTDAGKWLFGSKPFEVLNNGIDLEKYAFSSEIRQEYRQKLGVTSERVVGHVGNFIPQKNHGFLLESFAELLKNEPNSVLVLFGDGDSFESAQNKIAELKIEQNIRLMGKSNEIHNFLQAMDVFALPSLYEGLPVVLVEAQSAGLPCIVADTVAREANLSEEMKYIPIDSAEDWAKKIAGTKPLSDEERAEKCALWQQKVSEKGYDIKKNANKMKEMYISYLNR